MKPFNRSHFSPFRIVSMESGTSRCCNAVRCSNPIRWGGGAKAKITTHIVQASPHKVQKLLHLGRAFTGVQELRQVTRYSAFKGFVKRSAPLFSPFNSNLSLFPLKPSNIHCIFACPGFPTAGQKSFNIFDI